MAGTGVETSPVPPESSWWSELAGAVQAALMDALAKGSEMLRLPRGVLYAIAIGLAVLALLLIVRVVWPRRRRKGRPGEEEGSVAATSPAAAPRDAAQWRAELERRLAAGSVPEALEAAWWWLARAVAGERAEPDWTSRDLVARSRRPELAPLIRRLDAFLYGPRQPGVDELRTLVGRLEEALS